MISVKEDEENKNVKIAGDIPEIMTEAAIVMHEVCQRVSELADVPYKEVQEDILLNQRFFILVDSGMDRDEAAKTLGLGINTPLND